VTVKGKGINQILCLDLLLHLKYKNTKKKEMVATEPRLGRRPTSSTRGPRQVGTVVALGVRGRRSRVADMVAGRRGG
jgi:hypothetical protein